MNERYIKHFDENGTVINPIIGARTTEGPNRRSRRQKPERFRRNKKGISLSIFENGKYSREWQIIRDQVTGKVAPTRIINRPRPRLRRAIGDQWTNNHYRCKSLGNTTGKIDAAISHIAIGTRGDEPQDTDTDITNAVRIDITSVEYPANGCVRFTSGSPSMWRWDYI